LNSGGSAPHPLTTPGVFLGQARLLTTRPFAHHHRDGRWQDISWIELEEHALRIASGLVAAGVDAGDRVLLLSGNRAEWLACDLGIQVAGAATVPVAPSASPEAAQAVARRSAAVLAIVSGDDPVARLHLTDTLGRIVRLDGEVARWLRSPFEGGSSDEVRRRLSALGPDDVATIDVPAVARASTVVSHGDLVDRARASVEEFGVGPTDRILSVLRCANASERLWGLFVPAAAGATVWLSRGLAHLAEDVQAARPTLLRCTPAVLATIQQRVEEDSRRWLGPRRAVEPWAIATGRERATDGRPDPRLLLRHRVADAVVLASLRRQAGGGRLRLFVAGDEPLPAAVSEFFPAIGLPVRRDRGRQ
jgi:long-chain acyl-CoA synthetase